MEDCQANAATGLNYTVFWDGKWLPTRKCWSGDYSGGCSAETLYILSEKKCKCICTHLCVVLSDWKTESKGQQPHRAFLCTYGLRLIKCCIWVFSVITSSLQGHCAAKEFVTDIPISAIPSYNQSLLSYLFHWAFFQRGKNKSTYLFITLLNVVV